MESEQKPKARARHPDRVSLSPEALNRITSWLEKLRGHLKGNRVTRNDLVNFLILSRSAQLSEKEVTSLAGQYYDEVRFAEWAVKQLKEARSQGQKLTLDDLIKAPEGEKRKGGADVG